MNRQFNNSWFLVLEGQEPEFTQCHSLPKSERVRPPRPYVRLSVKSVDTLETSALMSNLMCNEVVLLLCLRRHLVR